MSDEEAIALIESHGSLSGLGPINSFGTRANVWQVTPDTILKVLWEPAEPYMMEFVSLQTSLPIPKIRRCITWKGFQYLFMEYVEGSDLYEIWPSLSLWRRFMVAWTLRGYIRQVRAIELPNKDIPGHPTVRRAFSMPGALFLGERCRSV